MPIYRTEPPKPPRGYKAEKPVCFEFKMTGSLSYTQDWGVCGLRCLNWFQLKNATSEWTLELEEGECRVTNAGKRLEEFPVDLDDDLAPACEPYYGASARTATESVVLRITGPWKWRECIEVEGGTLRVGEEKLKIIEGFLPIEPEVDENRFFIAGDVFHECPDLARIPFTDIPLALELFLDMGYILDHSPLASYPEGRVVVMEDVLNGNGWGKLVALADSLRPEYRTGLRCRTAGIDRLVKEAKARGLC